MTKATHTSDAARWAPWWLYLIVLLGANYLRAWLLPTQHLPTAMAVAIAVGQAALLFLLITVLWRTLRRTPEQGARR